MKEGGMFMTNEKFIGFTMEKTKHIALVAHDGKRKNWWSGVTGTRTC